MIHRAVRMKQSDSFQTILSHIHKLACEKSSSITSIDNIKIDRQISSLVSALNIRKWHPNSFKKNSYIHQFIKVNDLTPAAKVLVDPMLTNKEVEQLYLEVEKISGKEELEAQQA
jgi:hypothetical protein